MLTACQHKALARLLTLDAGQEALLLGAAGTGKTYLLGELAEVLYSQGHDIVALAPTHRAVDVLRSKLPEHVFCYTIHSGLGLSMEQGEGVLNAQAGGRSKLQHASYVLIDEASMIDEVLLDHIRRQTYDKAVLYVGDPAQLPPIDAAVSPVFLGVDNRLYLSTITRQAAGDPIITLGGEIRLALEAGVRYDTQALRDVFPSVSPEQACEAVANDDSGIIIAWRNSKVDYYNLLGRRFRGDTHLDCPVEPGHIFVANEACQAGGLANNEPFYVIAADPISHPRGTAWRVTFERNNGSKGTAVVLRSRTAYQSYKSAFWGQYKRFKKQVLAAGHSLARDTPYGKRLADARNAFWAEHSELLWPAANFSSTIHKSQGGTYAQVYLDLNDIDSMPRTSEHGRALYVALTRSRGPVFIIQGPVT